MIEQNQDLHIGKFYSELYKKYYIPKTINVGQTLANWKATTADGIAAVVLFKSSASGAEAWNHMTSAKCAPFSIQTVPPTVF